MTDATPPPPFAGEVDHAAPPHELVRSPLSDGEWHRLHPLTPLLRGGLFLVVVIGIVIANLRDRLIFLFLPMFAPDLPADEIEDWEGTGDPIDFIVANNLYLLAAAVVLAVLLALVVIFYLSWRFHTFRITGDDVEVRSGILFRTQRRAPLDRVQGVNLTRPMIARLLGMAKLEVVGAGTDANVKLEYLSTSNAEAVRADILRLASGRRLAEASAGAAGGSRTRMGALTQTVSRGITGLIEGDEAPVEVPDSVVHIPVVRLIVSHVVSPGTVGLLVGITAIAVGSVTSTPWLLFGMIPAVIGFVAYWIRSIVRSLRYSIAPTPDGVRITFGLLTTITEIVPPGRIHAVEVSQSILWRPFGWWTVRINRLTGRSLSDSSTDQFTTVLPVGSIADVERVLHLLLPVLPPEDWPHVRQGILGPEDGDPYTDTPRRAWFIRPLSWKRNGFLLLPEALLLRRGVVWRKLIVLPLARLQSLALHQGPVDRLAGVASAQAHTVAGPVSTTLAAIDRGAALGLFADVAAGSVRASSTDRSHRWAEAWAEDEPEADAPASPEPAPDPAPDPGLDLASNPAAPRTGDTA